MAKPNDIRYGNAATAGKRFFHAGNGHWQARDDHPAHQGRSRGRSQSKLQTLQHYGSDMTFFSTTSFGHLPRLLDISRRKDLTQPPLLTRSATTQNTRPESTEAIRAEVLAEFLESKGNAGLSAFTVTDYRRS